MAAALRAVIWEDFRMKLNDVVYLGSQTIYYAHAFLDFWHLTLRGMYVGVRVGTVFVSPRIQLLNKQRKKGRGGIECM